MHIEVFIHANDGHPTTASVKAWWVSGSGIHQAWLCDRTELDVPEDRRRDPWALLAALWAVLADRYRLRASMPAE